MSRNSNSLYSEMYYATEDVGEVGQLAELWSRFEILGDRSGNVFDSRTVVDSTFNKTRIKLGDCATFRNILGGREGAVVVDDDISLGAHVLTPWRNGSQLALSSFQLSSNSIRGVGWNCVLPLIYEHVSLADNANALYGLATYTSDSEALSGGIFGSVIHLDAPLHSVVEQSIWLQQGVKQKRVRGVYWGNYLSNELLEKLGGNLAEEYRAQAQNLNGDPTGLVWEFPNGTFVSISLDPTVGSPFGEDMIDIETFENLNWLVERFTEARLL